jgi:hypothetical protein
VEPLLYKAHQTTAQFCREPGCSDVTVLGDMTYLLKRVVNRSIALRWTFSAMVNARSNFTKAHLSSQSAADFLPMNHRVGRGLFCSL